MSTTDPQDNPAEATDRLPYRLRTHSVVFEKNRATGYWRAKCSCHWFWLGSERDCKEQAAAHDMWVPATPAVPR